MAEQAYDVTALRRASVPVMRPAGGSQMLSIGLGGRRDHLRELAGRELRGEPIAVADHCYGCTAGKGSSCGGALTAS